MVWTMIKEKTLNSVFGPLQETLRQKSRIVYGVLAVTFILTLISFVLALASHFKTGAVSVKYWMDPNDIVVIENQEYATVYAR